MALESVRLVNPGPGAFKSRFEGRWYEIREGGDMICDERMMWQWMGRPFARDKNDGGPEDRFRTEEFLRLKALYGLDYAEHEDRSGGKIIKSAEERWEEGKPRIEAYRLDGERIVTVLDDPDGDTMTAVDNVAKHEATNADARIDELRAEIQQLQKLMAEGRMDLQPVGSLDDVPDDGPPPVPVGPRRGKER